MTYFKCLLATVTLLATAAAFAAAPLASGDCFKYPTYEAWLEFIAAKGAGRPGFSLEEFRRKNPKARYDEMQAALECRFFTYAVGDIVVPGFWARPKTHAAKTPVIVYNRGGNGPDGIVNFAALFERIFPLAAQGFVVIGSQYREREEFGGRDVDDVLALLGIVDTLPDVQADRIGMLGWSRGGMMTFLAARRSPRFAALAVGGAPTDLLRGLAARPDMENVYRARIPDYESRKEAALKERSVMQWADQLDPAVPLLILHGQADERVGVDHALALAGKLAELKRPYRMVVYPNGDHGLTAYRAEVVREVAEWFRARLAGEALPARPAPLKVEEE